MRRTVWALMAALLVLAACGGDDDDTSADDTTTTSEAVEETTTTAAPVEVDAEPIEVVATDFAYEVPEREAPLPAGPIEISLRNDGAEEHQATVISFKPGKGLPDLAGLGEDDLQALYDIVDGWGGPNVVAPGGTVSATVDLDEGEYVFICFIPSPDGVPHAAKGMLTPFQVGPPEGEQVALPEGDTGATVVVKDYGFGFPEDFDGSADLTVVNEGPQPHELAIYGLGDGVTVADATAYLAAPDGPPPFTSITGVSAMNVEERNLLPVDLEPGEYMVICFLPDVSDGAPHFTKGMAQPLTVE